MRGSPPLKLPAASTPVAVNEPTARTEAKAETELKGVRALIQKYETTMF
jgi:hypothetical protein